MNLQSVGRREDREVLKVLPSEDEDEDEDENDIRNRNWYSADEKSTEWKEKRRAQVLGDGHHAREIPGTWYLHVRLRLLRGERQGCQCRKGGWIYLLLI